MGEAGSCTVRLSPPMFLSLPLPVRSMGMDEVRTQGHGVGKEPGKGAGARARTVWVGQ